LLTDSCLSNVWDILECKELTKSDGDLLGRAIQKTVSPNARSGMGQYFTPSQVIKFMTEVIQPKSDCLIIDPFHGSGEFLIQTHNYCIEKEGNNSKNLYGIEKNPLVHKLSLLKSMLYSSEPKLILGDGFAEISTLPNKGVAAFDAVLTNPPFGSKLQTKNILSPNDYSIIENRKSINTETLAVERSLNLLKEGGKFGIIVPDSFLGNRNHSRIRALISEKMDLRLVVSLPIETFTPFGANVKSSIIFGKKQFSRIHEASNTHLIQINHVGHDSVGRITEKNDFKEALSQIGEKLWR
jgi:type I restriction enzyme M protein